MAKNTQSFPEFESMAQMAGATGIPLAILRRAKASGCLFVSHSRCDLLAFLKWFFAQQSEDNVDWDRRGKRAAALIKEVKLDEERKRVIDYNLADRFITELTKVMFFGEIERLRQELPAKLKGKKEVEIADACAKELDHIKTAIAKSVKSWEEEKGSK